MAELSLRPTRRVDEALASSRGGGFTARVRLTTRGGDVLALPGETCERVPDASLGWLVEQGLIVPRN